MTAKRDLKRRVRERQVATGESYVTARQHVLAQRPEVVSVVDLIDLTEVAAPLGIKCEVAMYPQLRARVEGVQLLARLRDVLLATLDDRAFDRMRDVALRGAALATPRVLRSYKDWNAFSARARAGISGVNASGELLALPVDGKRGMETIIYILWPRFRPPRTSLVITSLDHVI